MDHSAQPRIRIAFDMETNDPDDALTLCLLAAHPRVELAAVTVNPGTFTQIGVVKELLGRANATVIVGARDANAGGERVSPFHYQWLGAIAPAQPDGIAHEILAHAFSTNEHCTLLTGAPLQNLRLLLRHHPHVVIPRWVAQGGFAGDNVVLPEHRLPKFFGRTHCESYNFGHDKKGALLALSANNIIERRLVGKNITHGTAWDAKLHEQIAPLTHRSPGIALAHAAMTVFLREHPQGKLLHDPLAAAAVICPQAFTWVAAEVVCEAGQWGTVPRAGTGTSVAIAMEGAVALAAIFDANNEEIMP